MNISRTVQQIQQVMRKDPGLDGDAQRITQLSWLLFLKAIDCHEQAERERSKSYVPAVPAELAWHTWTRRHFDLSGDRLLGFVNDTLLPGLRGISGGGDLRALIREIFAATQNNMRSGALLAEVTAHVDNLIDTRSHKHMHVVGSVYEKILADLQNAGNAGEFYTPKALTDLIATLVNPSPKDEILDFACGTGGFLVSCLEHIRRTHPHSSPAKIAAHLRGVEKKSVPYLLCNTNLLLHECPPTGAVLHGNLLAKDLSSFGADSLVDVIVTNPPFGAFEEEAVQVNFPKDIRSRDTADLFVALMLQLLRPGGRAAIILPDGFLFATGVKRRLRQRLLESCNVHTIVRLPKGVFSPYTGIATNIVFLTKGEPTVSTWYYEHSAPEDIGTYTKTKPIRLQDFGPLMEWWSKRVESPVAWQVPIAEIARNDFRLDAKNTSAATQKRLHPRALISRLSSTDSAIEATRASLADFIKNISPVRQSDRAKVLSENLDLIATSVDGVEGVKRLLLVLAMEGRLSPPNGAHETADVLLDQLQALNPDRSSPQVAEEQSEIQWRKPIPKHWRLTLLGRVGRIEGGGTPQSSDPDNFAEVGIPWVTPADLFRLKGKLVSRGRRDLSEAGHRSCSARLLPEGTVLFSSRAPIGYLGIAENELCTNQGFKSCVPHVPEMSEFIYYFLMYERPWIEAAAPGTTFKEVSGRFMKSIVMPLPPMLEQRYLVETLNRGFAITDELAELLRQRSSQFQEVVARLIDYAAA